MYHILNIAFLKYPVVSLGYVQKKKLKDKLEILFSLNLDFKKSIFWTYIPVRTQLEHT